MKIVYYCWLSIFIVLASCADILAQQELVPAHETFTIESKNVKEQRTINVWIPPGYSATTDSFAVLYMPDGGVGEDFPHIAQTISELVASKKIPPLLLVGIENTQRRRDLSGPTEIRKDREIAPVVGGSAAFRMFIKEELFPEINRRYRTRNERTIIGESLAGLFVMETFLQYPEIFDRYIAIDPSLWWNGHYLVKNAAKYLLRIPAGKKLWFAGSQAKDISLYTRQLSGILEAEKLPGLKWQYSDEHKEEHHTIFKATKEKALIWALNE
ncbi:alpha/beta hydrolase [Niabella hibiscisoli]|uniref:alpha/beta hydrolase n=1 Tax=Niabella hibiscisoli TaxID=1825928 RepID=UPI001F109ACF|nr:alpha/beta hydrolase-fold protein [Niabella hibiscisoli]MCH5718004.1 alpha/beta hydrolase-fold protein [Niabella hibiscisoli]